MGHTQGACWIEFRDGLSSALGSQAGAVCRDGHVDRKDVGGHRVPSSGLGPGRAIEVHGHRPDGSDA